MQTFTCEKGCCSIEMDLSEFQKKKVLLRKRYRKAGVFIYDPKEDRVLLVQSRGQLWGPPKGTIEFGENETQCAIREVKEETGLDVTPSDFTKAIKIKNRAIYFYVEMDSRLASVYIDKTIPDNDVNGITWIKLDCLQSCVYDGHMVLNQHCKTVCARFVRRTFPKSKFIVVTHKRRR